MTRIKHHVAIGDRFGEWTVIGEPQSGPVRLVPCRCSCGTEKLQPIYALVGRSNKSTRCLSCSSRAQRMKPGDKTVAALFMGSGLKSLPRLSDDQLLQLRAAIDTELSTRIPFR